MQMTVMAYPSTGASPACPPKWDAINWRTIEREVKRLQMRITKAIREGRIGKAKALQRLLSCSLSAKLMAVRRVVRNKGSKTPGVDGVVWNTSKQKIQAVMNLKRYGYKTRPLRRVYIPKRNGKPRPLSIPVMACRAQQALHLLGLEPISETLADQNAYGFRPKRSTADAIGQCFLALSRRTSAQWVLEGDIRSCFDKIRHEWLEANIPMDKVILRKWLKAGYVEKGKQFPTNEGTPQGGIISPTLLVMTLRGLEEAVKKAAPSSGKINVVIYADDFIVTGTSKEVLEQSVKPTIAAFLKVRGLELSEEKTKITHIEEGFDFLGQSVRKYKGKLLIKPSKRSTKGFLKNVREIVKSNKTTKTEVLIQLLNPKIRGWANYHRHIVAKVTFSYVDHQIFRALWQWAKRRHPNKGRRWIKKRYFRGQDLRHWIFFAPTKDGRGRHNNLDLVSAADTPIRRHVKIRGAVHPFDPTYLDYFRRREKNRITGSRNNDLKEA